MSETIRTPICINRLSSWKRPRNVWRLALLSILLMVALASNAQSEARYTQSFELRPGWNAVFLEVEPDDVDIDVAFSGIPVASVWRYLPDEPGADFVSDPAEGLLSVDGWYGYFPEPRPEAFLTNLFSLTANQAYLINLEGSSTVTWTITGRPALSNMAWAPNAFTLTGFNVDPALPPTFAEFFTGSDAHANQPIYQLSASGTWELASNTSETIASGEAYWVFTEGGSTFQGPLKVSAAVDGRLEFGDDLSQQRLVIENDSSVATDIVIRRLSTPAMPLEFEVVDDETGDISWPRLPPQYALPLPAEGDELFRVAVRRQDFADARMEEMLEITNGLGIRKLVFVGADTIQPSIPPVVAQQAAKGEITLAKARQSVNPYAGLWIGDATVDKVSEAQLAGTTPEDTGAPFPLRLMIHVDADGKVSLLKEVISLFEEGTFMASPIDPTFVTTDRPGRFVLVTQDELIPNFTGAVSRGGEPVGIRYSTVGFDFPEDRLELPGTFALDQDISGTIVLASDMPTNPFRHKFHPDHDNRDAQFLNFLLEAPEVTREFTLNFASIDPTGANDPDYGSRLLGGTFREVISGLHRNRIFVEGPFELRRISTVSVLNQ